MLGQIFINASHLNKFSPQNIKMHVYEHRQAADRRALILFASLDHAPELHSQDLPLYPLFAYRPSVLLIPRRFPKTIRRGLSDIKVSTSLLV